MASSTDVTGFPHARVVLDFARGADRAGGLWNSSLGIRAEHAAGNLWLVFTIASVDVLKLRMGPGFGECAYPGWFDQSDGTMKFEYATSLGPMRTQVTLPRPNVPVVRCKSSIVPGADTAIPEWSRDLYAPEDVQGVIHTAQRGPRTGVLFAASHGPTPFTIFYAQDFSSLTDYANGTQKGWLDTVGGAWPHMGFALPAGDDCILQGAREITLSDAYIVVTEGAPSSSEDIAAQYLDILAEVYLSLPLPAAQYHDWPRRALEALRDLSHSPLCTYERKGVQYLMPYVADDTKPPESMVQLTVAVNVAEYDDWRGERSRLFDALIENIPSFFDERIDSVVRWLPGEAFAKDQSEENMNHSAMDSWYLHHALFNLFRVARGGNAAAKSLFEKSLPYAIRVARRFDYRWPIFFDVRSLDIVRAESEPGKGGERDVAGLYALVMIHAYEMFGQPEYLDEAQAAASRLEGLGFDLAYQLNTTGFAAEATLRLWKMTGDRRFLKLSEVCLANLFDNVWLWRCEYGRARHYRTFFGLLPLPKAEYMAAYEELEAQAKAFAYLELGGDDVRPSVRLLLAEYQRYALDRTWFYYPDALPLGDTAEESRNGRVQRSLSIPLEDLRDGFSASGQVGQEVYGAGLPFVQTSRYFRRRADDAVIIYCNYPLYEFQWEANGGASFRTGGDDRGSCELRVIPGSTDGPPTAVSVAITAGRQSVTVRGKLSPEGHALFTLRGGLQVAVTATIAGANDVADNTTLLV